MARELFLPTQLNENTAVAFVKRLSAFDFEKREGVKIVITNFAKTNGRIEPFASLLVINSIKRFFSLCNLNGIEYSIVYTKEPYIVNTYAKNMRFYSSLGLKIGDPPDTDYLGTSKRTFIPIMKCPVQSIKDAYDEYTEIKKIAKRISIVATNGNQALFKYVNYCIIEILRNIIDHSESKQFWYAAQVWPSEFGGNSVEIAIMDEGIGIHESLKDELDAADLKNALKFSMIPGCSSKPTTHYFEGADNSGFGLFMISEISKENGNIILASNNEITKLSKTDEIFDSTFIAGTLIRLRFELDKLSEYCIELDELVDKGMSLTKNYLKYREKKKYAPGTPLPVLF